MDRAQLQIVLEVFEGGLDLGELNVEPPQGRRIMAAHVGAQEVAAFASPHLA